MLLRIADWLSFDLFGLDPSTRLAAAVQFFIYDSLKIFLLLAGMIFLIGVARTYLPMGKLRSWMGRGGIWGNVIAALFGAVTPFCSCSSIPLFIGFLKAGVPLGVCFSFLVTSPVLNEYLVILMAAEFGISITMVYVLGGLAIGVSAGVFLGRSNLEKYLDPDFMQMPEMEEDGFAKLNLSGRLKYAVAEVLSVLRSIWIWVLIGVGFGAFLHNYVPREMIHSWMESTGIFSVPLATILGVPLYGSCAAIVPVAVVLFEKGIPLGTALAFMMAMAALSLPEAILLRRIMRLPLIALFFGITAFAIMLTGYLLNILQPFL